MSDVLLNGSIKVPVEMVLNVTVRWVGLHELLLSVRIVEHGHGVSNADQELHDHWWILKWSLVTINAPIINSEAELVKLLLRLNAWVKVGQHSRQRAALAGLVRVECGHTRLERRLLV